jgi:hypothetical protein
MDNDDIGFYFLVGTVAVSISAGYIYRPAVGWFVFGACFLTFGFAALLIQMRKRKSNEPPHG